MTASAPKPPRIDHERLGFVNTSSLPKGPNGRAVCRCGCGHEGPDVTPEMLLASVVRDGPITIEGYDYQNTPLGFVGSRIVPVAELIAVADDIYWDDREI